MAIKHFAYVAAAGLTVALLIVAGNVLGRVVDRHDPSVAGFAPTPTATNPAATPSAEPPAARATALSAAPSTAPSVTPAPPAADPEPVQMVGIQPPKIEVGEGPFGSITGTGGNTVALTFDDGPSPDWTPQILDVLRQAGIKATFCVIGENVEAHPDLVRTIVADGHTLCNHSWNHNLELGKQSEEAIRADLQRAGAAIEAAAPGTLVPYFRAPGGNWTEPLVQVARGLGMMPLDWTVDPRDWTVPPVASIIHTVTTSCEPGTIFLLHDGGGNRAHTVDAVRQFLPILSQANAFIALPTGGAS